MVNVGTQEYYIKILSTINIGFSILFVAPQIQQTLNLMPAGLISPHQDLRIISPDVFKLFDDARAAMLAANDACVDDGGQESIGVSPADVPANVPSCYHGVSMRSVAFQPYSSPRIFRRFPDLGRDLS